MNSAKKEVRNLLLLLGSSILAAFLLVAGLVTYYDKGGKTTVAYVLLSPKTIPQLSFPERNSMEGGFKEQYIFDHVAWLVFDPYSRSWKKKILSKEEYERFFDTIASDQSLSGEESSLSAPFLNGQPSRLQLLIKPAKVGIAQASFAQVFQEVQLAEDGINYRIELREQDEQGGRWAYFRHPGILHTLKEISTHD